MHRKNGGGGGGGIGGLKGEARTSSLPLFFFSS